MILAPKSQLLLATRNQGKAREIQAVLHDLDLRFLTFADFPWLSDVEETGATFAENALLKAKYCWEKTRVATLADDSGLAVDALGGQPGVLSARFAPTDRERISRLLDLMSSIKAPEDRKARFVCALCLVHASGIVQVEASVEGLITTEPAGQSGFGYDPIFFYPPLGRTFAELSNTEKNAVSHRFLALKKLRAKLLPEQ
ncbi:MAG TPA: RdgB/HAM1 family non-canonical purine NTP pyrophosphatase [Acidobacteriota bacterium]|nr:RdgB/HAM1 family non-canonical purine NTP pyrophosphatase [Acidobacteriota bacterium]